MGKILKTPKAPSLPAPPEPEPTEVEATEKEPTADEQRVLNILSRNRGRMGTIATSFNGVLQDGNSAAPARKTLLGE